MPCMRLTNQHVVVYRLRQETDQHRTVVETRRFTEKKYSGGGGGGTPGMGRERSGVGASQEGGDE